MGTLLHPERTFVFRSWGGRGKGVAIALKCAAARGRARPHGYARGRSWDVRGVAGPHQDTRECTTEKRPVSLPPNTLSPAPLSAGSNDLTGKHYRLGRQQLTQILARILLVHHQIRRGALGKHWQA